MATAAIVRERPADGGVVWHHHLNAFECRACKEFLEIRSRRLQTPAKLAELRELFAIDHTECWEYSDARMARLQRRFRRELKRQMNLEEKRRAKA
jgi:hypothetical protein